MGSGNICSGCAEELAQEFDPGRGYCGLCNSTPEAPSVVALRSRLEKALRDAVSEGMRLAVEATASSYAAVPAGMIEAHVAKALDELEGKGERGG